jgi:hypothetical protein
MALTVKPQLVPQVMGDIQRLDGFDSNLSLI